MFSTHLGFPGGSEVKTSVPAMRETWGSIPVSGTSSGEGNGNPLQYSCLENLMDGGAWWATVHGVANSRTQLSDFTFTSLSTHLGKYQEARLLDCVVTVKKLPNCPTNYLYHFAFPPAMNKSFSCSETYQHLCC